MAAGVAVRRRARRLGAARESGRRSGSRRCRRTARRWPVSASIEPLTQAGTTPADLTPVLVQLAADDPTISAVRVWDAQHMLVASSDRTDQLGSGEALNDDEIDAAVDERFDLGRCPIACPRATRVRRRSTPTRGSTAPAGVLVTQFEAADATLLADVHQFWLVFRIVVGIATLLLLALAGLSMREPIAQMGANVPFYPESVPPWLAVMDVDRAVALEQAGDRAKDRLAGLQRGWTRANGCGCRPRESSSRRSPR